MQRDYRRAVSGLQASSQRHEAAGRWSFNDQCLATLFPPETRRRPLTKSAPKFGASNQRFATRATHGFVAACLPFGAMSVRPRSSRNLALDSCKSFSKLDASKMNDQSSPAYPIGESCQPDHEPGKARVRAKVRISQSA
jgi:hypothetical protein